MTTVEISAADALRAHTVDQLLEMAGEARDQYEIMLLTHARGQAGQANYYSAEARKALAAGDHLRDQMNTAIYHEYRAGVRWLVYSILEYREVGHV